MKNTNSRRLANRPRACHGCGKPTPRKSSKFCSRECWAEWIPGKIKRAAPRPACLLCKKPCRETHNRFCSKQCFCAWRRALPFKPKVERVRKRCEVCRKLFTVIPCQAKKRKFCGRDCYHEARVVDMETTTNTSIATAAWRRWRLVIIARDGGKCVFCGRPAKSVHHLKPRSMGGTHAKSNLVTACRICHPAMDKTIEIMVKLKPGFDVDVWLSTFMPKL